MLSAGTWKRLAPWLVLAVLGFAQDGWAKKGGGLSRSLAESMGSKPIEVKGQTRSLYIPPTTGAEKDQISFVKRRTNYRKEIRNTSY